jgi:hypothetical protein
MSTLDTWAGLALAGAGILTGLRANLLKPFAKAFSTAPQPVWLTLALLAIVELGFSLPLLVGATHAGAREAVIYTFLFLAAAVLVGNLVWHSWRDRITPAAAKTQPEPSRGLGPIGAGG